MSATDVRESLEAPEKGLQEEAARAWVAWLADANRLAGLGDGALVEDTRSMEELGRILDAGRAFAAGEMADRSRRELGDAGLARRHGAKDASELLERVTGASPQEARRRLRQSAPLQAGRSFTGEATPVAFPALRAAVSAGLMSAEMSAAITGPLAPLLERGGADERAWMRARVADVELELAAVAMGTRAVSERGGVLGMDASGREIAARMLEAARTAGASARPGTFEQVRRLAHAHVKALGRALAARSQSEGERRRVEREQREAQRFVSLTRRGDGLWKLDGILLPETAAQVMLLRDAVLNPKRPADHGGSAVAGVMEGGSSAGADTGPGGTDTGHTGAGGRARVGPGGLPVGTSGRTLPVDEQGRIAEVKDHRSAGQRFHDALDAVLSIAATVPDMPRLQGANPTLVITACVDQVEDPDGWAFLQGTHGEATSAVDAGAARHAGCAGTIHQVLTTRKGAPVSMTSLGRIFTADQREAIALRDGGCAWPACDVPATWVEIHHVQEWSKGGATRVDNGVSLCFRHHRDLEALGWEVEMRQGVPWFRPPPQADPERTWIRGQQSAHALFDQVRRRTTLGGADLPACDVGPEADGTSAPRTRTDGGWSAPGTRADGGWSAPGPAGIADVGPEADGRSAPATRTHGRSAPRTGDSRPGPALFDLTG